MEEIGLLEQYAETGSEEAFGRIVEAYTDMVYSSCIRQLADPGLAEDATQAVFIALAEKARRFTRETVLSSWLFKAAKYACLKTARSRMRREKHEKEAGYMVLKDTDGGMDWQKISPHLDDALMSLGGKGRSATILKYFRGKSYADIGKRMGISEDAAKMRVSRSVEKMRKYFSKKGITVSPAVLPLLIKDNGMHAVPSGLAESCCRAAVAGTRGDAAGLTEFENADFIAKGMMKMMMWAKVKMAVCIFAAVVLAGAGSAAAFSRFGNAEERPPEKLSNIRTGVPAPADGITILDTGTFWRKYMCWESDVVRKSDGTLAWIHPEKMVREQKGGSGKSRYALEIIDKGLGPVPSLPQSKWKENDYDDTSWDWIPGPFIGLRRGFAAIYMRGKFRVEDPSEAGSLWLNVKFQGGAVVYLNGTEICRSHIKEYDQKYGQLGEDYPEKAFFYKNGKVALINRHRTPKNAEQLSLRIREISGVRIPHSLLRKGTNVLAVEIHRAPVPESFIIKAHERYLGPGIGGSFKTHARLYKPRLAFEELSLIVGAASGVSTHTGKPRSASGFRVWNCPLSARLTPESCPDPCSSLHPLKFSGSRNGTFSKRLVVNSSSPIKGLNAEISPLKNRGEMIKPEDIEIRYAVLDGPIHRRYFRAGFFDSLSAQPPASVPVNAISKAAVQPVWISVHVPKNASAGDYTGMMEIRASGQKTVNVPVSLHVADYALPDSKNFVTHMGLIQSPDSVAMQYKVDMWSEKHWKLLDTSFELIGGLGGKVLYIPMVARTHFGNAHSMVRWIRDGDSWKYDYSIAERYIDLALKHLGKIPVICFYCWEPDKVGAHYHHNKFYGDRDILHSVLDPETGKLEVVKGPAWGTPACSAFWKDVMTGIREILEKKGLMKSAMMGLCNDYHPSKGAVENLKAAMPQAPWVVHSHTVTLWRNGVGGQPVAYLVGVWGPKVNIPVDPSSTCGWERPSIITTWVRTQMRTWDPQVFYRFYPEKYVVAKGVSEWGGRKGFSGHDGIGRLGADFWYVLGNKRGRKHPLTGAYSSWGGLDMQSYGLLSILGPGRKGPVCTGRYELFRESIQECEARIYIEKALKDKASRSRLGSGLCSEAQNVLNERIRALIPVKYPSRSSGVELISAPAITAMPGLQERSTRLYKTAAKVSKKQE